MDYLSGDRGLVDGTANATLRLADNVPLSIDVHRFWTAEQRSLIIGDEPAGADEASDLGWEFDFTVPVDARQQPGGCNWATARFALVLRRRWSASARARTGGTGVT